MKIGDQEFTVPTPSGMRSFALQQKIWPVAARLMNAVTSLIPALKDVRSVEDIQVEELLAALPDLLPKLGEVFAAMPPGELEAITRELLREAKCGNIALFGAAKGDPFDALMAGRTMDTWKLLLHAMEVWYPDFFGGARGLLARRARAGQASEGSSTSAPAGGATG